MFPSLKVRGRVPLTASIFVADYLRPAAKKAAQIEDGHRFGLNNLRHSLSNWLVNKRKSNRKPVRESCVAQKFRRRSICARKKTAIKRWRRRGNILRRWESAVRWCSELWVGLWVEVFDATPGNLLKQMVGLGGLEPPTSPLSGARSSHLSYRPNSRSNSQILARAGRCRAMRYWAPFSSGVRAATARNRPSAQERRAFP